MRLRLYFFDQSKFDSFVQAKNANATTSMGSFFDDNDTFSELLDISEAVSAFAQLADTHSNIVPVVENDDGHFNTLDEFILLYS